MDQRQVLLGEIKKLFKKIQHNPLIEVDEEGKMYIQGGMTIRAGLPLLFGSNHAEFSNTVNKIKLYFNNNISESVCGDILTDAFKVFDITQGKFDIKWKAAREHLMSSLNLSMKEWTIITQISGISIAQPKAFGELVFQQFQFDHLLSDEYGLDKDVLQESIDAIRAEDANFIDKITRKLENSTVAIYKTSSYDKESAYIIFLDRINVYIDVLNFFIPNSRHLISIEEYKPYLKSTLIIEKTEASSIANRIDTISSKEVFNFDTEIDSRIIPIFNYLSIALSSNLEKGSIAKKLITAVMWMGRARSASRKEDVLLFHCIGIELLIFNKKTEQINQKFKKRITHILSTNKEEDLKLEDICDDIYEIRSKIAHEGSNDFDDKYIELVRRISTSIVVTLITKSPFKDQKTAADLERLLEQSSDEIGTQDTLDC